MRADIFFKAREEKRRGLIKHVWSRDGQIKVRLHSDIIKNINTLKALDALIDSLQPNDQSLDMLSEGSEG